MKTILLASALIIGGVAYAQAEPAQPTAPMPAPSETMTPPPASDTATPPPAADTAAPAAVTVQQGGNMTPPPTDTGPYPRCSRTVTDHCQQSSARESDTKGGPPKHRRHKRR